MDEITEIDFDEVINDNNLTIVDFSATWCMPCRMLRPILERVEEKILDVNFCSLDIDESEDIAKRYRIFSVPTIVAFRNGKKIDSLVGLNSYDDVVAFVERCKRAKLED